MCTVILVKKKNHNSCTSTRANRGSTPPLREALVGVRLTEVAVKLPIWVGNYTVAAVHFPTAALPNSWQRRKYRHQQVGTAANQPLPLLQEQQQQLNDRLRSGETKAAGKRARG